MQRDEEVGVAEVARPAGHYDGAVPEVGPNLRDFRGFVPHLGQPVQRPGGAATAVHDEIGTNGFGASTALHDHSADPAGVAGEAGNGHTRLDGDTRQGDDPPPDSPLEERTGESHRVDAGLVPHPQRSAVMPESVRDARPHRATGQQILDDAWKHPA